MNERDIINRLIELIEDLQWDSDRMSVSGRDTLIQLETLSSRLKERVDARQ